ncbi:MAG: Flp family type IVb pilin [Myxococcota bacterium]
MQIIRDEGGATAIEYALIGTLVAVVIVVALANLGSNVQFLYDIVAALVEASV